MASKMYSIDVALETIMLLKHVIHLQSCKSGVFKHFYQLNPFDLNYLLKVPPEILSKYFNNLMAHLHV